MSCNVAYGLLCNSGSRGCTGMTTVLLTTEGQLLFGDSTTTQEQHIPAAVAVGRSHDWGMVALLARIMGDVAGACGGPGATLGAGWLHELFSDAPDKLGAMKAQVLGGGGAWRCGGWGEVEVWENEEEKVKCVVGE